LGITQRTIQNKLHHYASMDAALSADRVVEAVDDDPSGPNNMH
jgi:hypothetical protein